MVGGITMKVRTFWHNLANYALPKTQSNHAVWRWKKNFAAGWNENDVVARNTKFTAICKKFTPVCNFFLAGLNSKIWHFVLAKCLEMAHWNHDPYSTENDFRNVEKTGIFKDEFGFWTWCQTFKPRRSLLQAPPPSFLMLSSSKHKEVSQNCFVFDVVNFEQWGSLADLLRFWRCHVQTLRTYRRIASFLMLSIFETWGSLAELLRFWCCQLWNMKKSRRIAWLFKLADRQADR